MKASCLPWSSYQDQGTCVFILPQLSHELVLTASRWCLPGGNSLHGCMTLHLRQHPQVGLMHALGLQQALQMRPAAASCQLQAQLTAPSLLPPTRLPEHPVLIADSVAPGRQVQGGHGVQEAGSQAPQPAISQSSVPLLHRWQRCQWAAAGGTQINCKCASCCLQGSWAAATSAHHHYSQNARQAAGF